MNNLRLINIPEKLLNDFKNGKKTLVLRLSHFQPHEGSIFEGTMRTTNEISFGTGREQIL